MKKGIIIVAHTFASQSIVFLVFFYTKILKWKPQIMNKFDHILSTHYTVDKIVKIGSMIRVRTKYLLCDQMLRELKLRQIKEKNNILTKDKGIINGFIYMDENISFSIIARKKYIYL